MRHLTIALLAASVVASAAPTPSPADVSRRHMNRGKAAMKSATTPEDFTVAAKEFEAAAAANPKLSDALYNAGVAHEKAGDYAAAMAQFKAYLEAAPKAKDAQIVKDRIDALEFSAEKASDLSGCWQREDWQKSDEHMLQLYGADWCEFVIEKRSDGMLAPRVFKQAHTLRSSSRAPDSILKYSIHDVVIEGRKVRLTVKIQAEPASNLYIYDYDLAAGADGLALSGQKRVRNRFFDMDNESKVVLVRYKK